MAKAAAAALPAPVAPAPAPIPAVLPPQAAAPPAAPLRVLPIFVPNLPVQALLNIRTWGVVLRPVGLVLPNPIPGNTLNVALFDILLQAGIGLTGVTVTAATDPRAWFAIYRYSDAFGPNGPGLRLDSRFWTMDPRLLGVLSEEVAVGIACYVMRNHLDIQHIADCEPLIPLSVNYNPPGVLRERPDFYCTDPAHEPIFCEAKGVTGPRSRINGPLAKGKRQVYNVHSVLGPTRGNCGKVVIGTRFAISGHYRQDTETWIRDPKKIEPKATNPEDDNHVRAAYAKILKYVGQYDLADRLLQRSEWPTSDEGIEAVSTLQLPFPVVRMGTPPIGGDLYFLKELYVILALNHLPGFRAKVDALLTRVRDDLAALNRAGVTAMTNGVVVIAPPNPSPTPLVVT